jgi:hypothetical protein
MAKVYILDTSWLLEYYKLPNHHSDSNVRIVFDKFKIAIQAQAQFILPLAVIFEYCNHIAQISDGSLRQSFASRFSEVVKLSRNTAQPYLISPAADLPEIDEDLELFASTYAVQGIGLVDIQVERLAKDWSERYNRIVHIWTFDEALKAREPNTET